MDRKPEFKYLFPAFSAAFFLFVLSGSLFAQSYGPQPERFFTIQQNSVSTLEASGQTLWMAPGLNAFSERSGEIFVPENADSVFNARGRAFSLAIDEDRIFAGLGFTSTAGGENANAAMGYYQSTDNGQTWNFIPFFLDDRVSDEDNCNSASTGPPCDIEFEYGGQTYIRTRITVPELSPPFDVDFYENTLLSVNWASGLLRSTDNGTTWERIILPPSFEDELVPDETYNWFSQTPDGETVNRYDPRFDNNLLGFGLLIDHNQRVWAGTAGGVNISENALDAPADQVEWQRFSFDPDRPDGLLSNWVQKIRHQPGTDRIWMTNWRVDPENRDQNGLVYTDDLGQNFQHFLEGIRVNDVGFFEGTIFAAADNGLYISDDDGNSWQKIEQIQSPNTFIKEDARYFALASTDENIWVGTNDGIASTKDSGQSWRIVRADVPLRGGNVYQPDAPDTETYAYPNPFSPAVHSQVRIKFETDRVGPTTVRIFDFAMNPVQELIVDSITQPGTYETVWNGEDQNGRIVSGGTYFYAVETANGFIHGKILLLE